MVSATCIADSANRRQERRDSSFLNLYGLWSSVLLERRGEIRFRPYFTVRSMSKKHLWKLLTAFAAACTLFASGCATTKSAGPKNGDGDENKPRTITAEPMVILSGIDKDLGIGAYDDSILYEHGQLAEKDFKYDAAYRFYGKLVNEFPDSPLFAKALFRAALMLAKKGNFAQAKPLLKTVVDRFPKDDIYANARLTLGQCLLETGELQEALNIFNAIINENPKSLAAIDADFYAGYVLIKQERWEECIPHWNHVVKRDDINIAARIEANIKLGDCHLGAEHLDLAEISYQGALSIYRRNEREEYLDRKYASEAQFGLGEVSRKRFDEVKLEFPQSLMEQRLEEKAQELLSAQSRYIRAIRYGDVHVAAAAGYSIGSLYEDMYKTILEAPLPDELTEQQKTIYRDELKNRVAVLIRKAIGVYERTLDMTERVGVQGKWVNETQKHLDDMKQLYLTEQERMEKQRQEDEAYRKRKEQEQREKQQQPETAKPPKS